MMSKDIHTEAVDQLFEAILTLNSVDECYTFFEDACTINEILSLSQRFEVANMLREKKTYLEISEVTGASTATILSIVSWAMSSVMAPPLSWAIALTRVSAPSSSRMFDSDRSAM